MRCAVTLTCAVLGWLGTTTSAKYFSEGWSPGHKSNSPPPARTQLSQPPAPEPIPADAGLPPPSNGPLAALLSKAGVRLDNAAASATNTASSGPTWDSGVQLITDDNYDSLIANEVLSSDESERIWFIIVSVSAARQDGVSQLFDEKFDEAYRLSVEKNDLPHVRWGRIDYMNVTRITTKWNIWRGPSLVVLSDRGRTVRFLNARFLRPQPDLMRTWLHERNYLELKPWDSVFSPGGRWEHVLDYMAIVFQKWYELTTAIPRWMLYLITGGITSVVLQYLHRSGSKKAQGKQQTVANLRTNKNQLSKEKAS